MSFLLWILSVPLIGCLFLLIIPHWNHHWIRIIAFNTSLLNFLISLLLWIEFNKSAGKLQFMVKFPSALNPRAAFYPSPLKADAAFYASALNLNSHADVYANQNFYPALVNNHTDFCASALNLNSHADVYADQNFYPALVNNHADFCAARYDYLQKILDASERLFSFSLKAYPGFGGISMGR